jgi:hypothetical protein
MQWNEIPTNKMPSTTGALAKLIGAWQMTVTYHEGPLEGQVERNRVIFAPITPFSSCSRLLGREPGGLMPQVPSPSASRNCSTIVRTEHVAATSSSRRRAA